jgi:signal transduction histidine kinase
MIAAREEAPHMSLEKQSEPKKRRSGLSDTADRLIDPRKGLTSIESHSQGRAIFGDSLLTGTLDLLQNLIAVLNEHKQVVYANQAFLEVAGSESVEELCGMRHGEIFHCVYASETGRGCGTSENCRFCGAIQAIEETQATHRTATRECRITSARDGRTVFLEFRVRTLPFELTGSHYIMVSFRDIENEKRRIALERIFFHDILNTASSIRVYLDLLKAGLSDQGTTKLVERLEAISGTLIEEIQSQKILVSAENKTLTVSNSLISSAELMEQLIAQFVDQDISRGKTIAIAPFSESLTLMSDDSLLRRVLANMVKNALEASPAGSTVTLGFSAMENGRVRFWVHNPTYMTAEVRRQIFQRYFSTKGEDRGLGTYSMKLLTEEYLGGKVSMESYEKKGTTFTVTLPKQREKRA